jgi:hypothetical protein
VERPVKTAYRCYLLEPGASWLGGPSLIEAAEDLRAARRAWSLKAFTGGSSIRSMALNSGKPIGSYACERDPSRGC